jgi:hypothetical protein
MAILSDDAINEAMMGGLVYAFKEELKEVLMTEAENQVEALVEKISRRLRIKIERNYDDTVAHGNIKLQWLFKRE